MENNNVKHVAIVGAGLVGSLEACYLAKRGYTVDIYELRSDIRTQQFVKGRSINLALSCRGRQALKDVLLEDEIVSNGTPMYARMIHNLDGSRHPIPYGTKDQYIISIDRRQLNETLLNAAEKYANVTMHFEHKLVSCDFTTGELLLEKPNGTQIKNTVDLIIGTDGAYSSVRKQMMKATRFDYSQTFIPHGYVELCIPAKNGQFNMEVNYLHIWPRGEFMMIALPNSEDQSFVVTLFMPFRIFESLTTEEQLMDFFKDKFPDAIPLIGEHQLKDTFFQSKPLPVISIKCSPYHIKDKVVIMGDAAHAMVPFYGQGMNCGFEDCIIFNELLDKYNNNFEKTLAEYTAFRKPDAQAICDLAMYNYVEMRDLVNSRLFLLRKKLDNFLYWLMPNTWVPLYTMVSFTRIRYHEAIERRNWQDKVIKKIINTAGLFTVVSGIILTSRYIQHRSGTNFFDLVSENLHKFWK